MNDEEKLEHRMNISVGSSPKPRGISLRRCCCYTWTSCSVAFVIVMVLGIQGLLWNEGTTNSDKISFPPASGLVVEGNDTSQDTSSPPLVNLYQPTVPSYPPPSPPPRLPPPPLTPLSPIPDLAFLPGNPVLLPCNPPVFQDYWPVPVGRKGETGEIANPLNVSVNSAWLGEWKVVREDPGRKEAVVEAMKHAWKGYSYYAFGFDELRPLTKYGVNNFGGLGLTIIDSLDSLWLMGLTEEFDKARKWVAEELSFDKNVIVSVFETTIRILGGLLSAYDLTGEVVFAIKAEELGRRLLRAFETPSGIPYHRLNLRSGEGTYIFTTTSGRTIKSASLAEVGTLQLEFNALSRVSGDPIFERVAARAFEVLTTEVSPRMDSGLYPTFLQTEDLIWTAQQDISFGSHGDSFYEYLLKVWIQRRGSSEFDILHTMWTQSMDDMINVLLQPSLNFTFIAERRFFQIFRQMDHLACFAPGMLDLGAPVVTSSVANLNYSNAAEQVLKTCVQMYHATVTGLAPETTTFPTSGTAALNTRTSPANYQRPETVESLFVNFRRTGDQKMRDQAWTIFQAFEQHSRVDSGGYSGFTDVNFSPPPKDNYMQSFFLAETLKYLFLIYSESKILPLDVWVLNTEAHPLQVQCHI
eukprot:CAMPEP_0196578362 /NCGR_PEP_ID=MMETSP1081-20130531/7269_1 /TAXON_ID=36882 /ORGANISM="Pyramimonas amylifera, Strain CCMP720" /LENGTH=638 /DNA_ID=CAMNT_0041897561 /DNA_START=88 /DNA_END=2007 /DNA_ORIENTATION=+